MKKLFLLLVFFSSVITQVIAQTSDSLLIEGNYRSFYFVKPTSQCTSLVFVVHGSNGDGQTWRNVLSKLSKYEALAQEQHMLLVYPSAYKRYWNECRKASPAEANQLNINEQAFFQGMIDYFVSNYGVNPKNVFIAGTSGGGHMAYKLAMTMPNKFRAITAFIANLPDDSNMDCDMSAAKALPVMIVNGTVDTINPYNGGDVNLGPMKLGAVRSTDRTLAYWAGLAHYKGLPQKEILPDVMKDDQTIEKYTYKKKRKPEIVLYKVNGMKHAFPTDMDGMVEALNFFNRQK